MRPAPVTTAIVLIGGGHSHIQVLKLFGMRPEPDVQLTLGPARHHPTAHGNPDKYQAKTSDSGLSVRLSWGDQ